VDGKSAQCVSIACLCFQVCGLCVACVWQCGHAVISDSGSTAWQILTTWQNDHSCHSTHLSLSCWEAGCLCRPGTQQNPGHGGCGCRSREPGAVGGESAFHDISWISWMSYEDLVSHLWASHVACRRALVSALQAKQQRNGWPMNSTRSLRRRNDIAPGVAVVALLIDQEPAALRAL